MRLSIATWGILVLLVAASSCKKNDESFQKDSTIVAMVNNRKLYMSELDNIIHPAISQKDSTALANSYIDQWVRDQLLMQEASKFFSTDFEIEKLVDDYREKLIKFNFEEKIIAERFDTLVTDNELSGFYEKNKEQFVLNQPLFRCYYAKVPDTAKKIDNFYRSWRKNDTEVMDEYLSKNSIERALDEKRWYTWPQIENWSDQFSLSSAKSAVDQHISDGDFEYFLKVLEYRAEKEISPLPFIKDQLVQMILHKRKQNIIEGYKTELYDKAIQADQIKLK